MNTSYRSTQLAEIVNAGIQPVQNFAVLKKVISLGGDKMAHGKETIKANQKLIVTDFEVNLQPELDSVVLKKVLMH